MQGEEGQESEAVTSGGRKHLPLGGAGQQAVLILGRDEPHAVGGMVGLGDPPPREVRVPDVAHLALADEVGEGVEGFFDRRRRVGRVQLVQVDPVGAQASERVFDGTTHVRAGSLGPPGHRGGEIGVPELRGQHDLIAAPLERLPHQRLGQTELATVHVGGVEESHARIDRRIEHRARSVECLGGGSRSSEVVAPESDRRDAESGAADGTERKNGGRHLSTLSPRTTKGSPSTRGALRGGQTWGPARRSGGGGVVPGAGGGGVVPAAGESAAGLYGCAGGAPYPGPAYPPPLPATGWLG